MGWRACIAWALSVRQCSDWLPAPFALTAPPTESSYIAAHCCTSLPPETTSLLLSSSTPSIFCSSVCLLLGWSRQRPSLNAGLFLLTILLP
ncbi:hypothetical protein BDW72DRAFT_12952 [Aspergillus terricola var. indicus]